MNTQYKQIVCPLDFSETSERALAQAAAIAGASGARLVLLNVLLPLPVAAFSEPLAASETALLLDMVTTAESARAALERLRDRHCAKIREQTSLQVATGHPFVEIVKCARESGADLIVMGSHGRTGLEHMLLGSVAERVVRKAPCSVLVVRDPQGRFSMP